MANVLLWRGQIALITKQVRLLFPLFFLPKILKIYKWLI